ncbi:DinB family protein [Amorphus sp. 3PC139-8]|uniref:DinB family protein n=1 Tax=Amorphus sp. 3PC139-8 TaxID=2735676 RepID=UPI00345D7EC1
MRDHFKMMASYNAWSNARLYATVAELSDADYRADLGAFFKSVHGTLNHILVADQIWMNRFSGSGPLPTALDQVLHEDFAPLQTARSQEDQRIVAFADALTDDAIAGHFHYYPLTEPDRHISQPLGPALSHFFNHQTHHRGQVHTLLTRLTGEAPSLDLIYFQRETGTGLS